MPNAGVVSMVVRSAARRRNLLLCVLLSRSSVVQDWPAAGTYWRSSVQTGQAAGGVAEGEYCVPQVIQMKAAIEAGYTAPWAACQRLQISRIPLRLACPPLPTMMWSCTEIPSGPAMSMIALVIWISACDGVGSPGGWLCTRISAVADNSSARLITSRG